MLQYCTEDSLSISSYGGLLPTFLIVKWYGSQGLHLLTICYAKKTKCWKHFKPSSLRQKNLQRTYSAYTFAYYNLFSYCTFQLAGWIVDFIFSFCAKKLFAVLKLCLIEQLLKKSEEAEKNFLINFCHWNYAYAVIQVLFI